MRKKTRIRAMKLNRFGCCCWTRLSIYMPLILPKKITQIVIPFYFIFCATAIRISLHPPITKANNNKKWKWFPIYMFCKTQKNRRKFLLPLLCSTQITFPLIIIESKNLCMIFSIVFRYSSSIKITICEWCLF